MLTGAPGQEQKRTEPSGAAAADEQQKRHSARPVASGA
jgi:hypothetical protein